MTEKCPRHTRARLAVVGLLVLSAFSLAAAWGRKPLQEEEVKVTVRPLTTSQTMSILREFPELVPNWMASVTNDSSELAHIYGYSEVTTAVFKDVFPAARFYRGHTFRQPPSPILMAIESDKRYMMPGGFNRLLFDGGMKVTDRNVITLAKAFVIVTKTSMSYSYPEITFLGASRAKQLIGTVYHDTKLNVKVAQQLEEWYFAVQRGQFNVVSSRDAAGIIKEYSPAAVEPTPKR